MENINDTCRRPKAGDLVKMLMWPRSSPDQHCIVGKVILWSQREEAHGVLERRVTVRYVEPYSTPDCYISSLSESKSEFLWEPLSIFEIMMAKLFPRQCFINELDEKSY